MGDKYVDDLLGPAPPEIEDEPSIPVEDAKSGSMDGPPDIEPMREPENEEMPPVAFENDKVDVLEPPSQGSPPESKDEDVSPPLAAPDVTASHPVPDALAGDVTPPVAETPKPDRETGLRNEIVRLRAELKKGEVSSPPIAQAPVQPAPGAYPPGAPGAGKLPPDLPNVPGAQVVVSEDGTQVYLPDEEINRRVAEQVQQAMQPSPQQQVGMAIHNMEQGFAAENPERNAPAVQQFQQVDEYLGLKLAEMQKSGWRPSSVPELTQAMKATGVEAEFAAYFPETAPMFDELIAAVGSQQPAWRRSILERMAFNTASPSNDDNKPAQPLADLSALPQSLARKGGTRSQAPDADNSEFKKLEAGFHADPVGFPKAQYKRYQELGRKLKEDGFESI